MWCGQPVRSCSNGKWERIHTRVFLIILCLCLCVIRLKNSICLLLSTKHTKRIPILCVEYLLWCENNKRIERETDGTSRPTNRLKKKLKKRRCVCFQSTLPKVHKFSICIRYGEFATEMGRLPMKILLYEICKQIANCPLCVSIEYIGSSSRK